MDDSVTDKNESFSKPIQKMATSQAKGLNKASKVKRKTSKEDMDKKLEDQITNEKLTQLERIFEEADEDGGGESY